MEWVATNAKVAPEASMYWDREPKKPLGPAPFLQRRLRKRRSSHATHLRIAAEPKRKPMLSVP
jgi:hypothetical protein